MCVSRTCAKSSCLVLLVAVLHSASLYVYMCPASFYFSYFISSMSACRIPCNSFAKAPPRPPLQGLSGYNPGYSTSSSSSSDLQGGNGDQQQQQPSASSSSSAAMKKPTRGLSAAFASTAPRTVAIGKKRAAGNIIVRGRRIDARIDALLFEKRACVLFFFFVNVIYFMTSHAAFGFSHSLVVFSL